MKPLFLDVFSKSCGVKSSKVAEFCFVSLTKKLYICALNINWRIYERVQEENRR